MSWEDIDKAIVKTARIGVEHGVPGIHPIDPDPDLDSVASPDVSCRSGDNESANLEMEAARVDRDIRDFISGLVGASPGTNTTCSQRAVDGGSSGLGRHPAVLDAGTVALQRYGVGPCSARHYYGSFDTYIELEKKLAKLYPCLNKQAGGRCEGQVHPEQEVIHPFIIFVARLS